MTDREKCKDARINDECSNGKSESIQRSILLFDAFELVLKNTPNFIREVSGLRESRYVVIYQMCFAAVNFGDDRCFVQTTFEPSLDVDPGIVHSLDGRAGCHPERNWELQREQRNETHGVTQKSLLTALDSWSINWDRSVAIFWNNVFSSRSLQSSPHVL